MNSKIIFFFVFISIVFSQENFNNDKLSFELKIAQSKPDEDLTEMTLHNTDQKFYVEDSVYLLNKDLESAKVLESEGMSQVLVKLKESAKQTFANFTSKNIHKNAGMIIDGKLLSAPVIRAEIDSRQLIIMGFFSEDEAEKIAEGIIWR